MSSRHVAYSKHIYLTECTGTGYLANADASKFAVEGLSETLAQEVKDFGVKVANVQIGKPEATADAIIKLVDSRDPLLRLLLGREGYR